MMKKTNYEKIKPKICEELKRYGKVKEEGVKTFPYPIFISEIPYNGFTIIIGNPHPPKEKEFYYYNRSKYGWWTFCAEKKKLDKWDKKLLAQNHHNAFGQYREGDHTFCNDNQQEGNFYYHLHPNDMLEDMKQQINIFLRDREILKARENMTKDDIAKIEKKAKIFLSNIVNGNPDFIKRVDDRNQPDKYRSNRVGWLIKGNNHNYFVDEQGKAHYYEPNGNKHMQAICIVPKWNNKYIHTYDHIASVILALMNDKKTKKFIHTIE